MFHYARAIKTEIFIFLIAQVAEAIILHLVVLLALDVHGDKLPGILRVERMQHFEGFLHDLSVTIGRGLLKARLTSFGPGLHRLIQDFCLRYFNIKQYFAVLEYPHAWILLLAPG